jgi:serine/threonine protein kinase
MIGTTISHYRVVGKLGVGGMGVVYEAEDTRLGRRVALKFLPDELAAHPDAVRRLKREAQIIARLNHPNICIIYDIDDHGRQAFIAMERIDGVTLNVHMARKRLATDEIIDIALKIAGALQVAHEHGIVHRDIKPANVMVGREGVVKVLDFGLARHFVHETREPGDLPTESTIPGRPVGTVQYMAPERILQKPVDPRSDLFSLGVVLYEMATGELPFAGVPASEALTKILEVTPVALTRIAPQRPIRLERIVNRLLEKRPEDRYQSVKALQRDLRVLARLRRNPIARALRRS